MASLKQILEYQTVDATLRKIEQELASSEERKKFVTAKKFLETVREKLDAHDKRSAELARLKEELAARGEELSHAIAEYSDLDEMIDDGGDISFYKKNAQSIADKLRALKADLNKLNADIESAMEEYKKLKEQTLLMQKQYKEYSEKFKELRDSRAEEVNGINAKLEELAKSIPSELLEKYKAKRKERIFPILVPLTNGMCVCGIDFSLAQQGLLKDGNVIECEHCRRFIYKEA